MKGEVYQTSYWLLLEAARLRYEENLSQKEIAALLNVSNVTVSRALQRAKESGLVVFHFEEHYEKIIRQSEKLKQTYGLKEVIITDSSFEYEHALSAKQSVALEGARYIQRNINEQDIFGIAWGKTIYFLIQYLNPCQKAETSFITMHGSLSETHPEFNPHQLVKRISMSMGGKQFSLLHPALFPDSNSLYETLCNEGVSEIVSMFKNISVAVSGVGAFFPELISPLKEINQLNEKELKILKEKNCYCDFLMHFLDGNGNECDTDFQERTLSISLEDYKKIKSKIVVCNGASKAYSVRSLLRGNYVDVLVIDAPLANSILEIS